MTQLTQLEKRKIKSVSAAQSVDDSSLLNIGHEFGQTMKKEQAC
jgi:hypothetical protein